MKKFALIMIVGALALSSFAACGGSTTDESKADSSKIESSVAEESKTEVSASTDASADVSADEVDLTSLSTTLKTMITAEETLDKSGDVFLALLLAPLTHLGKLLASGDIRQI